MSRFHNYGYLVIMLLKKPKHINNKTSFGSYNGGMWRSITSLPETLGTKKAQLFSERFFPPVFWVSTPTSKYRRVLCSYTPWQQPSFLEKVEQVCMWAQVCACECVVSIYKDVRRWWGGRLVHLRSLMIPGYVSYPNKVSMSSRIWV